METVGIKELKAKLSAYLRRVEGGETLRVSKRGVVVAELRPPAPPRPGRSGPEELLQLLAEEGQVSRARRSADGWSWSPAGAGLPRGTSARVLEELREERDLQ